MLNPYPPLLHQKGGLNGVHCLFQFGLCLTCSLNRNSNSKDLKIYEMHHLSRKLNANKDCYSVVSLFMSVMPLFLSTEARRLIKSYWSQEHTYFCLLTTLKVKSSGTCLDLTT